ncbi:hypothetical protein FB451DRAFT_1422118 [Mycena latifolia]|nr:hypothetical protein FB451DRAFT_1422118 [Mycena latifolia]
MDAASPVPSGSRLFATGIAAAGPRASAEPSLLPSADTTLGSSAAAASGSAETSAPGGVTSKPIDTRVYSTSRLPCDYGYEDAPVLVTGMRFELPLVLRYTGRDVEDGDLCTEMWSPNSVQHAFLPGLESKELEAPPPSPSFAEGSSSWSPFIRRAHTWANDAKGRCLVTPVHAVWRTNAADRTARLAPDFITDLRRAYHSLDAKMLQLKEDAKVTDEDWDARPRIPENKPLLDELEAMCLYEDAVDAAALAQRVLRAMDAWTSMVSALQRQFVGVWINDAHEEYALWLLAVGVPVFIHHRYGPDEIRRSERFQTPRVRSYLEMTSTAPLLSASGNGFQFIAERERFPITTTGLEERGMGLSSSYDTRFTSSLLLEARREARAQGAELPNSPPRRVSLEEKYAPKPLELVVLDELATTLDQAAHGPLRSRIGYYEVVQQGGKGEYKLRRPSHWVYDKCTSAPGDVGKKPLTLDARLLPPKSAPPRHPGLEKGWKDNEDEDDGMSDDDDEGPPALPAAGAMLGQEENVAAPDATISSLPERLTCSPVDEAMPDAPPASTAAPLPPATEVVGSAVGPDRDDDEVLLGDDSELSDEGREPTPGRHGEEAFTSCTVPLAFPTSPTLTFPVSSPPSLCSSPPLPISKPSSCTLAAAVSPAFAFPVRPATKVSISEERAFLASLALSLSSPRRTLAPPSNRTTTSVAIQAGPPTSLEERLSDSPAHASHMQATTSPVAPPTRARNSIIPTLATRMAAHPHIPLSHRLASPSQASLSQRLALPGPPLTEWMNSESSETSRLITRLALPLSSRVQSIEHSETGRVRVRWRECGRRAGKHNRKRDKKDVVNSDEEDEDLSDYDN